ncbi:hypothetical protein NDK43_23955 [Neobacillus pocheonensis]|uniref:Resolvase/invertase-type recombinase catalytic domain-containing protein n=1 Tax=Neobacillus pocheonensis TaxID=363869 RepID=A0ABT0WEU5_9BACI|nr:hypothetical protein [Neobacillus pocheonensis]
MDIHKEVELSWNTIYGIMSSDVFKEKGSSAKDDRRRIESVIEDVAAGEKFVVCKLDHSTK